MALIKCTHCGASLKVASATPGKKFKCPKCAKVFAVEAEKEPEVEEPIEQEEEREEEEAPKPKKPAKPVKKEEDEEPEDKEETDDEEEAPKTKGKPAATPAKKGDGDAPKKKSPAFLLVLIGILLLFCCGSVGYTAFAFLETIKGWVGLGAATGKKLDTSKGGDQTKKPEPQPPIEVSTGFGMSLAVSSDGKYAVVSGTPNAKKNTAEIWNLQTKAQMHEFQGAVSLPVIAPDGKFVVFADARGAATKIDIESGKETHLDINPIPVPDRFSFVRCSPTGEVYLFANRKAITWDANGKHRVVWTFADDFGSITPFFDGGKKIAIGDHRGAVSIWEIGQPKPVKTMKHKGNNSIFCLASADGNSIAAVTMGRQLINWDLRSDEKQELKLSETVPLRSAGPGQILALTPDGKTLIYPTLKNNIVLVNVDSGQPAHELKGHTKEISALTITADGSTLVSLDRDNALKIWDIKDLK